MSQLIKFSQLIKGASAQSLFSSIARVLFKMHRRKKQLPLTTDMRMSADGRESYKRAAVSGEILVTMRAVILQQCPHRVKQSG